MQKISICRRVRGQMTVVRASNSHLSLTLQIQGGFGPRRRRAIALLFFRQLRPLLAQFRAISLSHWEDHSADELRKIKRGLPLFRHGNPCSKAAKLGFDLRMSRLKNGWNQKTLAALAGISSDQVSRIERALCQPRPETRKALESAFSQNKKRPQG